MYDSLLKRCVVPCSEGLHEARTDGRVSVSTFAPRGKKIHVIANNLSAHKTKRVAEFPAIHPNVQVHFTRTYSSLLTALLQSAKPRRISASDELGNETSQRPQMTTALNLSSLP
jgi:hypothetical protein